jgi:hypothetical protein
MKSTITLLFCLLATWATVFANPADDTINVIAQDTASDLPTPLSYARTEADIPNTLKEPGGKHMVESFQKRQSYYPSSMAKCSEGGCCQAGYYCTTIQGQTACCPGGKICTGEFY